MTPADDEASDKLRIDRWLWCARFFKTRGLAAEAVRGGHIRVNGQRVKPAREVKSGDALSIVHGTAELDITVAGIPARRGPAAEAGRLYVETAQSIERRRERREQGRLHAPAGAPTRGRPDKRTRRLIRSRQRSPSVFDDQ